ncbi:MAG: hypothetical protein JWN44_2653, partial [Myxococcales bacterium]|nr:hypothetical protein [Myxococcales bacterium]
LVGSGGGGGAPAGPDAGRGGLGGGAVALLGADVNVSGTIDVRGNVGVDANPSASSAGGGGGGSGGSILVSGGRVVLDIGHDFLAAGGKGGRGVSGGVGLGISGGDGAGGRIYLASDTLQIATGMTAATSDVPAVLGGSGSSLHTFPR